MREFEFTFEEGLRKGLRNEGVEPFKDHRLVELKNLRPSEFGLRPVETLTNPFSATFVWPFPQMMLLRELRLMCTETAIYTCDSSWSPTVAIDSLVAGGMWHVADFGQFVLLTNGSQIVQRHGSTGVWSSFTSTSAIPAMNTMCAFKGRVVGGNLSSWYDCDSRYVAWSDIGSASFLPDIKNTAGYVPLERNGSVLRVLPLGDMVAVYGTDGVALLRPANQYMGLKQLDLPGLPNRNAVASSDQAHVFVDYAGELWMLGADGKAKNMGFGEYIGLMDAAELVVSYNRQAREFYISDGDVGYVLGEHGLCQTHQLASSVEFDSGVLYATYESDGDTGGYVTTDVLDLGLRAFKTLATLACGCSSASDMWTRVYWRSDVRSSFSSGEWQWVNPSGFTTPMITAEDFKLAFKAEDYTDVKLAYFKARTKLSDKRMIRGIYSAN